MDRHLRLNQVGSLGKGPLPSEYPLAQLREHGQNLTCQVAPGRPSPLSVLVDSAWPDRLIASSGTLEAVKAQHV